jgi:hypothetical protein
LSPYQYANYFSDTVPKHLIPNEIERTALAANEIGEFRTLEARRFATKIFQMHKERRVLAAHLFYTQDHRYWHIFYFDNRDRAKRNNHWKLGSHIHYSGDLWTEISMDDAWRGITGGSIGISKRLHIRYHN